MKFVLAPDSFKESMTAKEVCQAMENGIRKVLPDAKIITRRRINGKYEITGSFSTSAFSLTRPKIK